jgi:2-amino-4-hydroxy-6-hydroxymethyldihydropteridine diphosphokinase
VSIARAIVGLGANLGDPAAQLRAAIDAIGRIADTRVVGVSSLYRTAPVGHRAQPDFFNAAVAIETALEPRVLLAALQSIERAAGRERSFKDAPRTLDLDILLYGERSIDEPGLKVPHPRLHERAFALAPLAEIAPDAIVAGRGRAADLLGALSAQRVERLPCP